MSMLKNLLDIDSDGDSNDNVSIINDHLTKPKIENNSKGDEKSLF